MYEPALSRLPSKIWELILFQSISSQYLGTVCPSSRFWELPRNTKSRYEFDRAERHRLRLRYVCSVWRHILDAENHRLIGSIEHQTKYSTGTIRRARKVEKVSHLSGFLQQTTRWVILCSTAFSDPSDLDTLARNTHLHLQLQCLIFQTRRENQNPLSPQLTISLLSNITFLFIRTYQQEPIVSFWGPFRFSRALYGVPGAMLSILFQSRPRASFSPSPFAYYRSYVQSRTRDRRKIFESHFISLSRRYRCICAGSLSSSQSFSASSGANVEQRIRPKRTHIAASRSPLERLYLHEISIKWRL